MKAVTTCRFACVLGVLMSTGTLAGPPANGKFDTNFVGDGVRAIPFDVAGNKNDEGKDILIGPDGSMYVIGDYTNMTNSQTTGIAKLNRPGSIYGEGTNDLFFGDNGKLSIYTGYVNYLTAAAVFIPGAPGRILVARSKKYGDDDIEVCQINSDTGQGVPFEHPNNGPANYFCTDFFYGTSQDIQTAVDLLLQPDGKFIVVGTHATADKPNERYAWFVRFNPDGSIDNTFSHTPFRNNLWTDLDVRAAALGSDGKIVAVGVARGKSSSQLSGLIIRVNSDGTEDSLSIANQYWTHLGVPVGNDVIFNDVSLVNNNSTKIVAVGAGEFTEGHLSGVIARFNAVFVQNINQNQVNLDTTFGDNSSGYTKFSLTNNFEFSSVASDTCIGHVAIGHTLNQTGTFDGNDIIAMNYNNNGLRNYSFGENGGGTVIDGYTGNQSDYAGAVKMDSRGIYVTGSFKTLLQGDLNFAAVKLTRDTIFCNGFHPL